MPCDLLTLVFSERTLEEGKCLVFESWNDDIDATRIVKDVKFLDNQIRRRRSSYSSDLRLSLTNRSNLVGNAVFLWPQDFTIHLQLEAYEIFVNCKGILEGFPFHFHPNNKTSEIWKPTWSLIPSGNSVPDWSAGTGSWETVGDKGLLHSSRNTKH